jgi:uncharacterized protein (TIGR00290 family)
MPTPILFCWSGGKDSCLALHKLRRDPHYEVVALLTTVTETYDRISMHGVRRVLLEQQAAALGLPLEVVTIPPQCINATYEARMEQTLARYKLRGVLHSAFGDIFLEDLRTYREQNLARIGMEAVFPIWRRPTDELVREFINLRFRAVTACVDPRVLAPSFAGREINSQFLADLPAGVDPCGENGEFHSFVFDGPDFSAPIDFHIGELVLRDGFCFCDLLPANSQKGERS